MKYFLGPFLFWAIPLFAANNILALRARVPAQFEKSLILAKASQIPPAYTIIKDPKKGQVTVIHR